MAQAQAQAGQEFTTRGSAWGCNAADFAQALSKAGYLAVPFGPGGPPSIDVQDTRSGKSWLVQWDSVRRVWNWYLTGGEVVGDFPHRAGLITDALASARDCRGSRRADELFAKAVAAGGPWAGDLVRDIRRGMFVAGQVPELVSLLRRVGVRTSAREIWSVLWQGRRKAARFWEVG